MKLTPKQTELIKRGITNGQLVHTDFIEFYATSISRRETINRFLTLNIIRDIGTKFLINKEVDLRYVQSLEAETQMNNPSGGK